MTLLRTRCGVSAPASSLLLVLCAALLSLCVVDGAIFPPPTINGTTTNIRMRAFSQLQFVSITKIDGVEQAFNADFYMLSTWAAPKHDPAVTWSDDLVALSDFYWQPQLDFINAIGGVTPLITDPLPLGFTEEPLFDVAGIWNYTLPDDYIWCTLDQRYVGSFLTPVDMQKFPFDSQKVLIQIESYWDTTQVEIVFAEPAKIDLANLFPPTMPEIIGWESRKVATATEDFYYAYNTRTYNRLTLTIWLNRQPGFFLDKIISGCSMLVIMCILLFLLTAEEADRFMGAMAIFAGLVAYLFVASQYTPVVPYQTALDKFLSLCFFEVLFMTFVHGLLFYMREREKLAEESKAMRDAAALAAGEEFDGVEDAPTAEGEGQLSIKSGDQPADHNQDINAGVALRSSRVADDAMPGAVEMQAIASPSAAGAAQQHEAAIGEGTDGAAASPVVPATPLAASSSSSASSIATPPPAEKTAAEIAAAEDEADANDPSLDPATRAVRRFGRIVNRFTNALGSTLTKLEATKEAAAADGGGVAAAAAAAAVAAIAASKSDDEEDDGPPVMGANGLMRPKPKGGKRGRKRARKNRGGAFGALNFMTGLVPIPNLSAWANSLTFVRKLDFAFMFAFSAVFVIGTSIIFVIPQREQQEV